MHSSRMRTARCMHAMHAPLPSMPPCHAHPPATQHPLPCTSPCQTCPPPCMPPTHTVFLPCMPTLPCTPRPLHHPPLFGQNDDACENNLLNFLVVLFSKLRHFRLIRRIRLTGQKTVAHELGTIQSTLQAQLTLWCNS